MTLNFWSSFFYLPDTGIIHVCHHSQLFFFFLFGGWGDSGHPESSWMPSKHPTNTTTSSPVFEPFSSIWLNDCLRFSMAVIKTMTKNKFGRKGLFSLYFHSICSLSLKENRVGTWRQELITEAIEDAAYWLAPDGSLSLLSFCFFLFPPAFLSYSTQEHQPRDGTTQNGLGSPTLITN